MVRNTSKHKKTYSSNKTAVITIETPDGGERVVEATHYIRSDDGTVSIYQGARSDGIDIQTHITRCVIDRVDELPSHEAAFSGMFDDVPEIESGTDDEGDGDGPELVSDGGQVIEPGDEVRHAGEQWRVARCNSRLVEIYQLGSVSEIVPVSDVAPAPEPEVQG
jgi:hypothetical protein